MAKIEKVIFRVFGGLGKNVMATAVCEAIKTQYPDSKLVVVASFPGVFFNNPFVDRVYAENNVSYFYEDHIQGNEDKVHILSLEPYGSEDHILEKNHLIETWCSVHGIKYNGEQPKIHLTVRELQSVRVRLPQSNKPILLIQPFGGPPSDKIKYNWNRDLPPEQIQNVVDLLKDRFNIIQICREDQIKVNNCVQFAASDAREIAALISLSDARLFIDSSCQHIAAAVSKPSVVCWCTTKPWVFGYSQHTNVVANKGDGFTHRPWAFLSEADWTGVDLQSYPYEKTLVFNYNEIIDSLVEPFANAK